MHYAVIHALCEFECWVFPCSIVKGQSKTRLDYHRLKRAAEIEHNLETLATLWIISLY